MKPKSLQNLVSKRSTVVESFFCQLSSQLGSHLSVLVKPFQKAFWACKINRLGNVFCGRAIPSKKLYAASQKRKITGLRGVRPCFAAKRGLTLVCRLFLAGSTRVAVILNPPAGPLRRFDFDGLVTGSVLVRVLRCCEWQE